MSDFGEVVTIKSDSAGAQPPGICIPAIELLLLNVDRTSSEQDKANHNFLVYIYEQIDNLLRRCISHSNSRSGTPLVATKTTIPSNISDPLIGKEVKLPSPSNHHQWNEMDKDRSNNSHAVEGAGNVGCNNLVVGRGQKAPRRVKLFTSVGSNNATMRRTANPGECSGYSKKKDDPLERASGDRNKKYNSGDRMDGKRNSLDSDCEKDFHGLKSFRPPHTSSPSIDNQRTITLADFVTPNQRQKRGSHSKRFNTSIKQSHRCSTLKKVDSEVSVLSLDSSSCGSWALGLSDHELTPLETFGVGETDSQVAAQCNSSVVGSREVGFETKSFSENVLLGSPIVGKSIAKTWKVKPDVMKPSRRITPTVVSADLQRTDFKQQAVFTLQSPEKTHNRSVPGNFSEERQRLKERKAQLMVPIANPGPCTDLQRHTVPSKLTATKTESEQCVEPQPVFVTNKSEVEKAATLFSTLISEGKTQNLTADFHLIVQLLCCQLPDGSINQSNVERNNGDLLDSAHNGVYFAISVLLQCQVLHVVMDDSVRRLLSENERVMRFSSKFSQMLSSSQLLNYTPNKPSTFSSVTFQTDTDDLKNFPSDKNFILFKKQRDIFYEVKREWDSKNTISGWSFRQSCNVKIYQLLNQDGVEVSNYVHFARLFVSQLTLSCLRGLDEGWSAAEEDSIALLSNLRLSQPDKYIKLRQRLIRPPIHSIQLTKQADFSGQETFFKLFIDVANDATFIQHLKDCLTLKLLQVNLSEFEEYNEQDSDKAFATGTLSDCVLTARLLAKFLGYLHFLPYVCNEKKSPMVEQYVLLRGAMCPPLDISLLLNKAIDEGRCVLTVPWVVQYLSMLDTCTAALSYYHSVLTTLHQLLLSVKYRLANLPSITAGILLQYACITWLFNLTHLEGVHISATAMREISPDCLDSITHIRLVYDCSYLLKSTKCLLLEYVVGLKSKVNVSRKITPLTAQTVSNGLLPADTGLPTIQQSLENNFFHNQPASLKKSVTFIAERVTSSYIKEFRATILTDSLTSAKAWIHAEAKKVLGLAHVKASLTPLIECRASELSSQLYSQAMAGVSSYFKLRVGRILELLLPSDSESYIGRICRAVVKQQGMERVVKWLGTNLTEQYIAAELTQELTKYCRSGGTYSPPQALIEDSFIKLGYVHDEAAPSPSKTLQQLQLLTGESVAFASEKVGGLEDILAQTVFCLTGRGDIECIAANSICYLVVVLLVHVATHHTEKITPVVLDQCSKLWTINALQSNWDGLVALVPAVEGLDEADNLWERLYDYILFRKKLLSVSN